MFNFNILESFLDVLLLFIGAKNKEKINNAIIKNNDSLFFLPKNWISLWNSKLGHASLTFSLSRCRKFSSVEKEAEDLVPVEEEEDDDTNDDNNSNGSRQNWHQQTLWK